MNRSPKVPNPKPKSLRVAAVKMIFADSMPDNQEKIEEAATKAAKVGADAVLFPECATTGYACDFGALKPTALREALRSVAAVAARLQVHLLVGSPIFAERRLYNALVVFDRRGRLIHTYAKCQLTDADRVWFTPGNGLSLFALDGVRATAMICHERRYPELVRLSVMGWHRYHRFQEVCGNINPATGGPGAVDHIFLRFREHLDGNLPGEIAEGSTGHLIPWQSPPDFPWRCVFQSWR